MTELVNKTAIVTGGSRGIGKAIALTLAGAGANVVISGRTKSDLRVTLEAIQSAGGKALMHHGDVAEENSVRELIGKSVDAFGTIDILVNNAGVGTFTKIVDMATKDFDEMFATNVRGVFLCTRAVLPFMIRQKSGDVINISSLAGRNAFVTGAGYCATKWALIGFARSLMLEVREHNIRVITICPGSVDTAFDPRPNAKRKESSLIPKAEDVARIVLDALKMPRNVMVSEIDVRPTNPQW